MGMKRTKAPIFFKLLWYLAFILRGVPPLNVINQVILIDISLNSTEIAVATKLDILAPQKKMRCEFKYVHSVMGFTQLFITVTTTKFSTLPARFFTRTYCTQSLSNFCRYISLVHCRLQRLPVVWSI